MYLKHTKTTLLIAGLLATPLSQAATLTVDHTDIKITGGLAAGAFYSTNHATVGNDAPDAKNDIDVTDMVAELSLDPSKSGVGFTAGLGRFLIPNVLDGGKNRIYSDAFYKYDTFKLQYGYATLAPTSSLSVDAGILATNVGYEAANTMKNPNITTAALWNGQPAFYPGARATYAVNDSLKVYIEGNNLEFVTGIDNNRGSAYGVMGSAAGINYVASYMVMNNYKDVADLILSGNVGGMDVALNLDYNKIQNCTSPCEENPWGVALYVTPKSGNISYPIRIEYIKDGGGAYESRTLIDMKKAYTFTVTPTYHFSDSAFVRAELSYVSADQQAFVDNDGVTKDNKSSAALQAGVTF